MCWETEVGSVLLQPKSDRRVRSSESEFGELTQIETSPLEATVQFEVPANSLIIVGSLDVSGAAHSLQLSAQPPRHQTLSASLSSKTFVDLEYIDSARLSELQHRFQIPKPRRIAAAKPRTSKNSSPVIPTHSLANKPTRRFLIPHFEVDGVTQQPCEAESLAEGSRVKVYMDLSIARDNSDIPQHHSMHEEAKRVCRTTEYELLPLIEQWIGRITDLDGDHRLSVVLTDLDRREFSSDTPILGCVRRRDFSACDQNSLTGDIIYLDQHLPPQEQLHALLAHELTHAAIFCIRHEAPDDSPLKDHSVPSWLNEAAAHWVERQFCSTPAGYAAREVAFRQSPAQCPIILKDEDHHLAARRTGSRVAGCTFLQQHLPDPGALRELLEQCTPFDQSITATTHAPFSQLFRQWTISQTCSNHDPFSPLHSNVSCCSLKTDDNEPIRRQLYGTAFLILHSEAEQSVTIETQGNAQLQITVLYQMNRLSTLHSHGFSTKDALRSAGLQGKTPSEIR